MSNQVIVDLFVEDRAHESFLEPLLMRVDFAFELVEGMDLYRAGRNDSSLNAFLRDLRAMLRQVKRDRDEMG